MQPPLPPPVPETAPPAARAVPGWVKPAIDFGPVLVFFVTYQLAGIMPATIAVTIATVIAAIVSKLVLGSISTALLVTAGLSIVFGGLTIALDDERFLKIRPTIQSGLIGGALVFAWATRRDWLRAVFGQGFPAMRPEGWRILTRNYGFFFLGMAVLNEVIWRSVPTGWWVTYNVWGDLALTFLFVFTQMPILNRYMEAAPGAARPAGPEARRD
jgi:intracellular septation protein